VQQPSSLIFLAIVVIWAAYLLQHWIRRREALATARSVDQFSDAMRVLERREHPIEIEGIAEQMSDTSQAGRASAPPARDSVPRPSLRAGTVMTGEIQPPVTEEATAAGTTDREGPSTRQRLARAAATAGSPKLRAVALVVSVAILLVTIVCAPFGAVPWWSPILMLALSGGVFYWCRVSAMAAADSRATRPAARRATGGTAPRQARGRRPGATKLPKPKDAAPLPIAKATMPAPTAAPAAPVSSAEQVFDVSAAMATPAPATEPRPAPTPAAVEDGGWQPVAVPAPTYTLKERAPQRPQPAPAPTSGAQAYEHVANEDLPFDGLALDQDLEELPAVFRAG